MVDRSGRNWSQENCNVQKGQLRGKAIHNPGPSRKESVVKDLMKL